MMEEKHKSKLTNIILQLMHLKNECINQGSWRMAHCCESAIKLLQTQTEQEKK